ncbi:Ctr copper transporter family-domain-containing protein [Blastocladiella britannica]|nr:Ctr copper transporter family-domain-containing protein [Blastocladiella britannica]
MSPLVPLLLLVLVATLATAQSLPDRAALTSFCTPSTSNKYGACTLLLRGGCQQDTTKPYCSTPSLLAALCTFDNPPDAAANLCTPYSAYCAANPSACTGTSNSVWPGWSNSTVYQNQIRRMCGVHNMDGCGICAKPAAQGLSTAVADLDPCDSLATYVSMCKSMPDMSMCGAPWKAMCQGLPNSVSAFPNICSAAALTGSTATAPVTSADGSNVSAPGAGGSSSSGLSGADTTGFVDIPPMRMYFHQDINDLLLFKSWVTVTAGQYWGVTVGMFAFSFGYFAYGAALRKFVTPRVNRGLAEIDTLLASPSLHRSASSVMLAAGAVAAGAATTSIPAHLKGVSRIGLRARREALVFARAFTKTVELAWSYLLMLAIMSFNYGWFAAFLLGALVGNVAFNRAPGHFPVNDSVKHQGDNGSSTGTSLVEPAAVQHDEEKHLVEQPTCC